MSTAIRRILPLSPSLIIVFICLMNHVGEPFIIRRLFSTFGDSDDLGKTTGMHVLLTADGWQTEFIMSLKRITILH